nr:ABC transporter substrate-binding protein [uncultured Holophaga sp.]
MMRILILMAACFSMLMGQVVQESFSSDPGPLDFIRGDGQEQIILQMLTGDALTGLDTAGRPVPRLATHWELRPAGILLHLRTDARFQDGNPVSPEDAAWTFRRIQTDPGACRTKRSALEGVEAEVHPGAILLRTHKPPERLLRELAFIPIARRGHPELGSGPFGLTRKEDAWILQARRQHFLTPRIQGFRFRLLPDSQAILQNLRKGWLSLGTVPPRPGLRPPPSYRELRQGTHAQLLLFSRLGPDPLRRFETWRRDAMPAGFLGPQAVASRGLWPESLGFPPATIAPPGRSEPEATRLEVLFAAGDELVQRLLLAYRARAARDGFDLVPRPVEPALLLEHLERGDFTLACALNLFEPHPWSVLDFMEPGGALNFCDWRDPAYEGLRAQLREARSPAWNRLAALWARHPAALPLLDFSSTLWVDQRLELIPSPMGLYFSTPGPSAWRFKP